MTRPEFSICICPDSYLLLRHMDRLVHDIGGSQQWQRHIFWGDEPIPGNFWEHLTLQSLFSSHKLLIIRNTQNIQADTLRKLSEAVMRSSNKNTWTIFCMEVPFDKGKPKLAAHILKMPFFQLAEKNKYITNIDALNKQSMRAFLVEESKLLALRLNNAQLDMLCEILPADAAQCASEVRKLALCKNTDGQVTLDLRQIVEHTPELGIFELLAAIQQRKSPQMVWQTILEDQIQGESMVFAFNAVLLREARQLWQLLAGENVYLPQQVAHAKRQLAQRLGYQGIAKIWELARFTDKSIKTGEATPAQAFEILAADIFQLYS